MLRPGIFLQERYEIIEKIGSGGMADVYKAMCHKLNRMVAVKVLKAEFSRNEDFVNRFKLEAQAAARLSHPNIVNVYDVVDEDAIHYIIMELVEGITLKNYIASKGRLGVKETIGIAIQVAQGMWAAHQQNIIHRDIKPQNIIISKDGNVKVADFGIARVSSFNNQDRDAIGSVHYISPEQARGEQVDARSDIYSLGITMFEMATGRLPFDGENSVTVAMAHLNDPIASPRAANPDIPACLEEIIFTCTEKRPEDRYHTVEEVISDLRRALITPEADDEEDFSESFHPEDSRPVRQYDITHQLERIFAIAGVIAALMIVTVLAIVAIRLGSAFHSGNSTKQTESNTLELTETVGPGAAVTTAAIGEGQVVMPNLLTKPLSLTQEEAREVLEGCGLKMVVSSVENSNEIPIGYIMAQEYPAGTVLEKNTTVNVKVSKGRNNIDLEPLDLVGMEQQAARRLLTEKKLVVSITEEFNDSVPVGCVIGFTPDSPKEGETVTLLISKGPVLTPVPDVTGKTPEEADALLMAAGFLPGIAGEEYSDEIEKGLVFNQTVAAGTPGQKGLPVQYIISLGAEETMIGETHYVASIDKQYNLSLDIGPGSAHASVQIVIRLRQEVNGRTVVKNLVEPRSVVGDTIIPISFSRIEGEDGVDEGVVELVDLTRNQVLASYPVSFFKTED